MDKEYEVKVNNKKEYNWCYNVQRHTITHEKYNVKVQEISFIMYILPW